MSVVGGKLLFQRPVHLSDSGAYECMVTNSVGRGKTEYMLNIDGKSNKANFAYIFMGFDGETVLLL